VSRALRHLALATASGATAALAWFAGPAAAAPDRLSLATAWICFVLLCAALAIGPLNVLRRGQPLLNNVLRRDLGIWSGLTGIVHLYAATGVVMSPAYFRDYITGPPEDPLPGWAGWVGTGSILAGYAIGLLFLWLLAISNDRALRRFGRERWKRIQRRAYIVFSLSVAHGVVFQLIEGRHAFWLLVLVAGTLLVVVLQWRGRRAVGASLG